MNLLERLRYRKIKIRGWQLPLDIWRRWSDAEVPKDTKYLGSFGIRYKGKPTGTYIDVYITEENGLIKAFVYTNGKKYWGGNREKVVKK